MPRKVAIFGSSPVTYIKINMPRISLAVASSALRQPAVQLPPHLQSPTSRRLLDNTSREFSLLVQLRAGRGGLENLTLVISPSDQPRLSSRQDGTCPLCQDSCPVASSHFPSRRNVCVGLPKIPPERESRRPRSSGSSLLSLAQPSSFGEQRAQLPSCGRSEPFDLPFREVRFFRQKFSRPDRLVLKVLAKLLCSFELLEWISSMTILAGLK